MVLNYIWIAFFLIAFVVALGKLIFAGDTAVFTEIINSSFTSAKTGFEISLGLTGILSLWLGIMKIGEKGGVIQSFARLGAPVFSKLFPGIPKEHPVTGSIFMNISANLLGLDNAATPIGLKTMQQLQELNTEKDSASNSMIMFLCINASGLTLIPVSIMMYRAQMGAANPSDVFLPLMLATLTSTLVAVLAVCIKQRINLLQKIWYCSSVDWLFLSEDWSGCSIRWSRSRFPFIRPCLQTHYCLRSSADSLSVASAKRSMYTIHLSKELKKDSRPQ